ncbi:MAG: hypothetical protein MJ231_00440 [bacterium]|nr:hypothetical protein [bacterium]
MKSVQNSSNKGVYENDLNFPNFINYSNISFGNNARNVGTLMDNADRLFCAYSGRTVITKKTYRQICDKLSKKPNLESAVNYLSQYRNKYMCTINRGQLVPTVEGEIFDYFASKDTRKSYSKKTFSDALAELKSQALEQLKLKQFAILNGSDNIIRKMTPQVAELVNLIKQDAILKATNDTFTRKSPLDKLLMIKVEGKDKELVKALYKKWFYLPSSSTDVDAFIVQYSKKSHQEIAERLMSPVVATKEHIDPQSISHNNSMSNYLIVMQQYNNERDIMPLNWFIELHENDINIKRNIQQYMEYLSKETKQKNSPFYSWFDYPLSVAETIYNVSQKELNLIIDGHKVSEYIEKNAPKHEKRERATKNLLEKYQKN